MSLSEQFDIGAKIHARTAVANTQIFTATSASPSTANGITVDRQESGLSHYYSCKSVVSGAFQANDSQGTVSLAITAQHSSDGTSWDSLSTATNPSAVAWGSTSTGGSTGTTGGTAYNTVEQRINLVNARRYIRVNLETATFSATSSGTLDLHGVIVFGGADEDPAS